MKSRCHHVLAVLFQYSPWLALTSPRAATAMALMAQLTGLGHVPSQM